MFLSSLCNRRVASATISFVVAAVVLFASVSVVVTAIAELEPQPCSTSTAKVSYLSQQVAANVDAALMSEPGFSVEALMELSPPLGWSMKAMPVTAPTSL